MAGIRYCEQEWRIAREDGRYVWCRIRATLLLDEQGGPAKALGVVIDIDDEKKAVLALQERAERDALTGLYNKGTAQAMMERCLSAMDHGERCAVLILDMDDFKMVNDMFGHLRGDVILAGPGRAAAEALPRETISSAAWGATKSAC